MAGESVMARASASILSDRSTPTTEAAPCSTAYRAMPAEAAAQIKHPLALERRKHPPQHMPLPGGGKPFL